MSLTDDIASLSTVGLFASFNEEQLRLIAFGGQKMEFPEGMEIFHNGQTADGGFVILSGEISIETLNASQKSTSKILGPGSLIGEMALFSRNRRTGTAKATKHVEVIKIRRDVMHRVLSEYPELAVELYRRIAGDVVALGGELEKVGRRLTREN